MKVSLVVLTEGKSGGKIVPITLSQFVIGRDPQCHLRPASAAISKRHCAVLVRNGKVFIRDFDSTNGTFVNDQQVKGEVELRHDDRLRVGPLLFGVKIEATPAVNRPTPPPAAKKSAAASAEDDAAAMLLEIGDDTGSGPSAAVDPVPEGSTVMDLIAPGPEGGPEQGPEADKEDKNKAPAKPKLGNTSSAAADLLKKYMQRPRT
jgi:predicted component of type VI protein secretion system